MQRRTKASGTSTKNRTTNIGFEGSNDKNKRRKCLNNNRTLFIIIAMLLVVICVPWLLFPKNELTETAIRAEHKMEDWLHNSQNNNINNYNNSPEANKDQQREQQQINQNQKQQQQQQQQNRPNRDTSNTDTISAGISNRASSDAATARMEAQSSRWVDGEKALKKKLQVLYDRQSNGKDLGVPVLTRYLGEDIPAWITPDIMDKDEWKKKVEDKYEEMRKEEEEWKKEMAKIITQRERDIGITTA
ncbi:MAG: hypothetical protein ACI90V_002263 [Bacillariaceae sp.]|jgi:hypothetical protein